jgi:hypothetical protein
LGWCDGGLASITDVMAHHVLSLEFEGNSYRWCDDGHVLGAGVVVGMRVPVSNCLSVVIGIERVRNELN